MQPHDFASSLIEIQRYALHPAPTHPVQTAASAKAKAEAKARAKAEAKKVAAIEQRLQGIFALLVESTSGKR